jgi:hypothetical protein
MSSTSGGFRFPGIQDVEHVYFYAATSATPELVKQYFQQAYELGRDFVTRRAGPRHRARRPDNGHAWAAVTTARRAPIIQDEGHNATDL